MLLGLSACSQKYSSKTEAVNACNSWVEQGPVLSYEIQLNKEEALKVYSKTNPMPDVDVWGMLGNVLMERWDEVEGERGQWRKEFELFFATNPTKTFSVSAYSCVEQSQTQEVLGYENKSISDGIWKNQDGKRGYKKIVRHFCY